ncbi:MAG: serine--tRNA ligase [Novosphingobium sp.]
MHDIRAIRHDPAAFDRDLARRRLPPRADAILQLDAERRAVLTVLQDGRAQRNALARKVGEGRRKGDDTADLEAEAAALRDRMAAREERAGMLETAIRQELETLPNRLDPDVPEGADETANRVIHQIGQPGEPAFPAKEHFELGEALGLMDFQAAARMSGARFTILRGQLARLERALGQFMLDLHTQEHGYTEIQVPLLVNDAAAYGTDKLPKFADDLFRTTDGRWLIPTAEVSLTNSVREQILPQSTLPMRLTALTPCFRAEAGAAGRDTRGFIRQHQFEKVEMVSICAPEDSDAEHERMTLCAEGILQALELPYRKMLLCAGDMGFTAKKTYDLEVWLPGQNAYREISSCSNCGDFQARRMNARFRPEAGKGTEFVHTLNGSGLAVGRTLVAVLENYQQADGSVDVPQVLLPYMGGLTRLVPATA